MWSLSTCAAVLAAISSVEAASLPLPNMSTLPIGKGPGSKDTGIYPDLHELDMSAISRLVAAANLTSAPHPGDLPSVEARGVIGGESRFHYSNPNAYPFRVVGKLFVPGGWCSGALVGPSLVATARHCATNSGSYQFCPSFDYDKPNPTFGCANAVDKYVPSAPSDGSSCQYARDFAILRIDKRFGDGLGFLGYSKPDSSRFGETLLISGGYPGDLDSGKNSYFQSGGKPGYPPGQLGCTPYGPMLSDLDAAGGQSGSPVYIDGGVMWGILSATTDTVTLSSGDKNLEDAILYLRNLGA